MSDTCTKIIVVVINVIFLIFGIACLALGVVFKVEFDNVKDAFDDDTDVDLKGNGEILGLACIIFGAFIIVLSFCGCVGAWCRNKCLLGVYGVVMLIILIAEIVCVAVVAVNGFDVQDKLKDTLTKNLKGFNEELKDDKSAAWAGFFDLFDCCGVNDTATDFGPTKADMTKSPDRQTSQESVTWPVACCTGFDSSEDTVGAALFGREDIKKCMKTTDTENHYTVGCEQKLKDWLDDNKVVLIAVSVSVFLLQVIIMIMAFCLIRKGDD